MPLCACGCGEENKGGKFLRGHDQVLRNRLEETVGGWPLLDKLVKVTKMYADGQLSLEGLGQLVQAIYRQD